jgi:heme exporter protein D
MIDLGPHAAFIIWAYMGVAVAVGALIAWTILDARRVERRAAQLEVSGGRRR